MTHAYEDKNDGKDDDCAGELIFKHILIGQEPGLVNF